MRIVLDDIIDKIKLHVIKNRLAKSLNLYNTGKHNSSFIIEFLGPPGVGKTTYSNILVKNLARKKQLISANSIRSLLNAEFVKYLIFQDFHVEIYNSFLNYLAMEDDQLIKRIRKLKFGLKELECDALSNCFNGYVINDEGISHHFAYLILNKMLYDHLNVIDEYLHNRLIILLDAPKEMILSNIRKNLKNKKQIWEGYRGLSDDEITNNVEDVLQTEMKLCDFYSKVRNTAVLKLNLKNDINGNINSIITHLNISIN